MVYRTDEVPSCEEACASAARRCRCPRSASPAERSRGRSVTQSGTLPACLHLGRRLAVVFLLGGACIVSVWEPLHPTAEGNHAPHRHYQSCDSCTVIIVS